MFHGWCQCYRCHVLSTASVHTNLFYLSHVLWHHSFPSSVNLKTFPSLCSERQSGHPVLCCLLCAQFRSNKHRITISLASHIFPFVPRVKDPWGLQQIWQARRTPREDPLSTRGFPASRVCLWRMTSSCLFLGVQWLCGEYVIPPVLQDFLLIMESQTMSIASAFFSTSLFFPFTLGWISQIRGGGVYVRGSGFQCTVPLRLCNAPQDQEPLE